MKKLLSFILALALVIGLVPIMALASEPTDKITLNFNNTTLAASNTTTDAANFEIVIDKTGHAPKDLQTKQARVEAYLDSKATTNWYSVYKAGTKGRFTVKTKIPAGNYKVSYVGGNASTGAVAAIYVGNEFVTMDDCYADMAYTDNFVEDRGTIGYVSVTPDAEGYVEITFLTAAVRVVDSFSLMLSSITFEKVDAIPEMSTEVKVGENVVADEGSIELSADSEIDLSARLKYSDGTYRDLLGYTPSFEAGSATLSEDAENAFSVTVEGDSVSYEKTSSLTSESIADTMGVYTGKLTAVKPGTSTITVTGTVNGAPKSQSFTVTVPYVYTDTGAETVNNKISYIVRATERANDSKVKVSDNTYTVNGTNVGEWTVGESFTATATGDDFAYWANGNGTPVSESASYTFTPTSNFTLEAVYAPADTTTKKVQFWNYNKVYLGDKGVSGDKVESMPANPSLNGYTFKEWVADGIGVFNENTTIEDAITRVVAQFTKNAAAFSVGGETKAYDDTFTKTAADTAGENAFSYWTIDGQVASYEKTLSFNVWDAVDVVPVYEGEKTAVPTVVLEKVDHTNSPDEYFILYEVPAGFTAVDAGIVFGTAETTPRVDSTDGSKASVKQAGAKGQFTAAPGDDSHTAARGYVMYRDSYNNLRVLYTAVK